MSLDKATLAAGCFWGVEETFRMIPGVVSTRVGYTGGDLENPSYHDVCSDTSGHAEAVEVIFDTDQVKYLNLLETFWKAHNPTTLNRQGFDCGTQYRSVIFTHTSNQESEAIESKHKEEGQNYHPGQIVTEILPVATFWEAEDYHQKYLQKRGVSHHC
tara:strand:+ start:114 stop:587 length:474 start_codon:yes stop_codon:yes gene_type:complete